jgi:hemoglobin
MEYKFENLEYWINRISTQFYDLIYEHEWLKLVFGHMDKQIINDMQIAFMIQAFGGPKRYAGRSPADAHPHIYVTEELWQERERLLEQAHRMVGAPPEYYERWSKIDQAFKKFIVMSSPDHCEKRWFTDEIINVPDPRIRKAG